ncbi:MAG: chromosome segregation protein SMC [Nitrospira sp.]|nr:MAG: chromosome segregation protein SMC [Nitrospira sp.]
MRICSFKIKKYKSFLEPRELIFEEGINLIVGQNNVGKTALLEALSLSFSGKPHRSQLTAQTSTALIDPLSSARVKLAVSGAELRELLLGCGGEFNVPVQTEQSTPRQDGISALEAILARDETHFTLELNAPQGSAAQFFVKDYPTHGLYPATKQFHRITPSPDRTSFYAVGTQKTTEQAEFGVVVASFLRSRIYRFDAQRVGSGSCGFGHNAVMHPTANNLPEVLNILQSNALLFQDFNELVHRIFPSIFRVSVRPVGNGILEILVWTDGPQSRREDLAIQLSESGTGVGQALALLYVVLTSKYSQTILIDEPSSFLHPAAARKLIEILKEFPQHQYIIATHSSEILRAASPATMTLIRWERPQSVIELVDAGKLSGIRKCLMEVGAKLSDVFGADRILWVEGDTEEECFSLLLAGHRTAVGANIVGVKHTGDFSSKRIPVETIVGIYEKLSQGDAYLPPAVGFVFDRESRTEAQMNDIMARSQNKVRFLPCRMYENYLLVPTALIALMNSLPDFSQTPIAVEQVTAWMTSNGGSAKYLSAPQQSIAVTDLEWLRTVDGANLLIDLFQDLSGARHIYNKTDHSVQLTEWLLKNDPGVLQELKTFLVEILSAEGQAA